MNPEVKFGIITGVGVCLWVLGEYFLGFHTTKLAVGKYSGYFSIIIPVVTIYLTLKQKRDYEYAGTLSIGQGIKAGLILSIISAVITTLFFMVYNRFINPDWMELAMEWEKNNLIAAGATEIEISVAMAQFESMNSLPYQIFTGLLIPPIVGSFIALVQTLILRRKKS
ncbi:MAG: DUF4199 domain-containing protein [bacterium]